MNLLGMMADAEARSTAQLVEMIAAAVTVNFRPPQGEEVVTLKLSQALLNETMQEHFYKAEYDDAGTMTLYITRSGSAELGQPAEAPEVTSE